MNLNYNLDINEKSTWFVNTPSDVSKRLPFYLNEYGHYIAESSYFTERKNQKNYLFIYTISGNGYLEYLGQKYILKPNQAFILYCDYYHMYETYGDDLWNFKWFHFNGTSAKEHYELLNKDIFGIITIKDSLIFEKMIDDLSLCFDINDISSNIKASMYITNIISYLITNKFTQANNPKYIEHRMEIENAINYIQNNYSKKIVIDDIIKIVCMSKYHFLRLFKSHVGASLYDYLLNYRINKAKELLRTTEYTVSEICTLVGFNDYNNFIREFKKITLTTPLKYRKI